MLVLCCVFLVGLIVSQISTTYSVYIQQLFPNFGMKAVGILFVLNPFLIVLLQTPLIMQFDNINKILLIGIGALLAGVGMFILIFSNNFITAIFACIVYTIGEMFFFPSAQLVCYNQGSSKRKGQSLGIFKSVYAISVVVGPAFGGIIYNHFGGNDVWYICGLIGLICFLHKDKLKTSFSY